MPDNGRFSEEEMERSLRDLGARMEYPPTPDLARKVRRELDEEEQPREARRIWRWPPFLAPRWTAVAAAMVLVAVVALSPATRTTLSDLFIGQQTDMEAGGAAKPGLGASESRSKQEAGAPSQPAGQPAAEGDEGANACPSPSIEATPSRAAAGAEFRLRGLGFSAGCDRGTPAHGVAILFRQDGETWKLATLDAESTLAFDARLRVPKNAGTGRATVLATTGAGKRAEERFTVLN